MKVRIKETPREHEVDGVKVDALARGTVKEVSPSIGSWLSYGLGTENENLPGYMLLNNDWIPNGGFQNFASGFLPATHQATLVRAKGLPVDNIAPTDALAIQAAKLEFLREQDQATAAAAGDSAVIESSIKNYETAARMQALIPSLCDVSQETKATREL